MAKARKAAGESDTKAKKVSKRGAVKAQSHSALVLYITRVGAEQRNFRRWVIKQEGRSHYHYDAAVITINKDGTITCSDELYAPTVDEAEAIAAELKGRTDWPTSQPARDTRLLRAQIIEKHGRENPQLFEYRNAEGLITFVQERVYDGAGKKSDLPWSFWSDGTWNMMEPDGNLPLFGLDELQNKKTIVLHEGASTAMRVQWLCDTYLEVPDLVSCPWIAELLNAAHLGWPGGAPNPHRVD